MPSGIEVTKAALDDFKIIQTYMQLAKKENATETLKRAKPVKHSKALHVSVSAN